MMNAVLLKEFGGTDQMYVGETERPQVKNGEVLLCVHCTAINRADTLQRKGSYNPPPGCSEIMGLEAVGVITAVGDGCSGKFKIGDRVMCLLGGGGYAEYTSVPEGTCMLVPPTLKCCTAAAIPETWLTAYQLLHTVGHVEQGDYVLIHAGASGVGTAAIQLARAAGAIPIVTCGSAEKMEYCISLGAENAFNYKTEGFGDPVLKATGGKGVNLILDCVGASHVFENFKAIAIEGRWILYGLMGGIKVEEYPLYMILRKRISLTGSTLRARSIQYKTKLVEDFSTSSLSPIENGDMKVIVDRVYDSLQDMGTAHDAMESNVNKGKIVVTVSKCDCGE